MRRLRMLQMMAGVVTTPMERRQQRQQRALKRLEKLAEEELLLVDKIRDRQAGAETAKPMPLARPTPSSE
jgi:hypothetical protein